MKKIVSILLTIWILIPFLTIKTHWYSNEGYFIVTAYYSPLPKQKKYFKANYELEKRLNWKWIAWASWKKVFTWMLAAPKNYKFGSKIYLEWLWTGEVSDRGQAIVNSGDRWYKNDRIDVWMWYGDEWLERALHWGKRKVKWYIVSSNSVVNLDYTKVLPSSSVINWFKKVNKKPAIKEIDIFSKKLSTKKEIMKLQETLSEMSLYSGEIDWKYKTIIGSIYNFQLSKNIVKSEYYPWAWTYGPRTRAVLKNEYKSFLVKKEEEKKMLIKIEEQIKKEKLAKIELEKKARQLEELSFKKAEKKLNFIWMPKFWEISHWVRELQLTLKQLGYFKNKDTAIYWKITKNSIISYQLDKKIISNINELWAWIIWPKTRESIKNDLKNIFLREIVNSENYKWNKT